MARSLVIVESPAKASTINRYLGKDFIVKSSVGHVRDLATSKKKVDPKERAKEAAKFSTEHAPKIHSVCRDDGYKLQAFVPANGIYGFDPEEHPQVGFHFVVSDRELGVCTMTVGDPFPTDADPSLWSTLDLIDA